MKVLRPLILALCILLVSTSMLRAEEVKKKPLDEVFDNAVIIPFDYHNKAFIKGSKTDFYGNDKLFQRNNRVLVPIRMMGSLISELEGENSRWEVKWEQQKPDDVTLVNSKLQKTIKLKVNSKNMYVNGELRKLDSPPQKLEGRIVLPLRGISEALAKKVDWLDGLIIISDEQIDLQSPQTLKIKDKIKTNLVDKRAIVDYEKQVTPVTEYGNSIYYIKGAYRGNDYITGLYKKTAQGKETKIDLSGEENLGNHKLLGNKLYYVSASDAKYDLYEYSLANGTAKKIAALGNWAPLDGWLRDVISKDNQLYIILHYGDNTMGGDTVYSVENGKLKEITYAKSIISSIIEDNNLYYSDFRFMNIGLENLFKVDLTSGEKVILGEQDFTYGIIREIDEDGSIGHQSNTSLYLKDNNIYVLGYQESDENSKAAVYKVSSAGKEHKQLTLPAKDFWLVGNHIYYLDLGTGYLVRVDLEGNDKKTIAAKNIVDVKFYNNAIYYTAAMNNKNLNTGYLYKYDISSRQETKISDKTLSQFFVGKAGVYYKSDGYDLGLFKIGAKGENIALVRDTVYNALLTENGLIYTLRYKEGIFSAK